ncbi:hypothetical protein ACFQ3K_04865 [Brucella gallinifaecis]|uniref:DUF5330 domain-containing protein n=1 Tax=Brucella gallinifaecis TaxID=215590 RepID=A0A502BQX8_9HYPH|nr:hypothetical protein [Brucella gallinifaecis]TPF76081.1 hypothetical protein FHY56_05290 [Brucella gallinifaecis]
MIRFLIKSAIWLSLAFMIMPQFFPADGENTSSDKEPGSTINTKTDAADQILANGKTALEIGKLCINNPALCETGASFLSGAANSAMEQSGGILEYLSERFGAKPSSAPQEGTESALKQQAENQPAQNSVSKIPIPTPRAEALRAVDRSVTGAIPSRN